MRGVASPCKEMVQHSWAVDVTNTVHYVMYNSHKDCGNACWSSRIYNLIHVKASHYESISIFSSLVKLLVTCRAWFMSEPEVVHEYDFDVESILDCLVHVWGSLSLAPN